MALPKQVREQGEAAEALAREHLNQPPANGVQDAAPAAQPVTPKADSGNWEKRFKGLKKTHDITVSGLRKELRELQIKVESASATPASPSAAPSQEDIMEVLTDEERKEYSPAFLDMVTRLAARVSGASAGDSALESRIQNLEVTTIESREDVFWKAITKAIPTWRKTQATEDMQAWLLEYDDLLGMTRNEAIADAQKTLNSSRVVAIFNQYSAPAQSGILDEEEANLILPEEGGGDGGLPPAADDTIWTTSQIKDFYNRLALGKFKGKEGRERAKQIELSIEKARAEDRIRQK